MVMRRLVVMGVAGCALVLVLAARPAHYPARSVSGQGIVQPAFPAYTHKATITWWDWSVNDDVIVKRFEQRYPSIHVIPRNVGGGVTEYTKLLTALKAGSGAPDVVQLVQSALPQFIAGGGLRDLAPLGAQRYRPYIMPWAWHLVTQGTSVYAIPVDAGPSALFYNSTIFKAYGLSVPTTWDQYLSAAATLHKANPRLYMTYFPPNNVEFFLNMAWAAGARPFVQTGSNSWTINLTSAPMLKVAAFWATMLKKGFAQSSAVWSAGWIKSVGQGQYASLIGAAWSPSFQLGPYVKPGAGWRAAALPQWAQGTFVTGNWGGSVYAVTTQSKYPAAALLFAAWLNTSREGIAWNVRPFDQGGRAIWPVGTSALEDQQLLNQPVAALDGQRIWRLFTQASRAVDTRWQWSPWTTYLADRYSAEIPKAIAGQESWAQALATIQHAVVQYAQQQGYTISQ